MLGGEDVAKWCFGERGGADAYENVPIDFSTFVEPIELTAILNWQACRLISYSPLFR